MVAHSTSTPDPSSKHGSKDLPEIRSALDLERHVPNAKTAEQRAHLHAAAHRLGQPAAVPKSWKADGSLAEEAPDRHISQR